MKTFLCAVAAQMFHKVVPTKSEVWAQPARPHQAPLLLLSVAWRWEGHGVWKAGCLPRKGCAYSLSGRSAAQPAPAPRLRPWSPRASAE